MNSSVNNKSSYTNSYDEEEVGYGFDQQVTDKTLLREEDIAFDNFNDMSSERQPREIKINPTELPGQTTKRQEEVKEKIVKVVSRKPDVVTKPQKKKKDELEIRKTVFTRDQGPNIDKNIDFQLPNENDYEFQLPEQENEDETKEVSVKKQQDESPNSKKKFDWAKPSDQPSDIQDVRQIIQTHREKNSNDVYPLTVNYTDDQKKKMIIIRIITFLCLFYFLVPFDLYITSHQRLYYYGTDVY